MRTINAIIIHCSATAEGKEFHREDIDAWHRARGFEGIGYHYVVCLDGSIEAGRDIRKIGAHCSQKRMNHTSIGVCYIGGCDADGKTPKDTRTPAQKESLTRLLKNLKTRFPAAIIYGHRDFAAKACPSFDAHIEYSDL
ncbi:MAG: N-acetylmuramoyl-L-alanine amidase [Muribaculaceae bacterium]|nr:N-acetylmuramoyl-L-alanine amidase [Muribaculaceae bacterium]